MNSVDFKKLVLDSQKRCNDILISKGHDYATDDKLSNFKRISHAAKLLNIDVRTPVGYSLFMVLLKLDRINNLVSSGKTPKNESVEDSYDDLINYATLSRACVVEGQKVNE